jgi:phospholipid/cholesterol/gamma-HCH transport system substrate-binding protein
MLSQRTIETFVGIFLLVAILFLMVLAFKVSGLTGFFKKEGYEVTAEFDDIGQLKVRGPVKIGGVNVGEVTHIKLDPETYRAKVTLLIDAKVKDIPNDSSASILTAGLLGDNYIAITPMYSTQFLEEGSKIAETHSAMVLEKMIGQFLFNIGQSEKSDTQQSTNGAKTP